MPLHTFQPHTCRGGPPGAPQDGDKDETPPGEAVLGWAEHPRAQALVMTHGVGVGARGAHALPGSAVRQPPPLFELPGGIASRMQGAGTARGRGPSDSGGDSRPPRPALTQGPAAL